MPLLLLLVAAFTLQAAERYEIRQQAGDHPLIVLTDSEAGVEASVSPKDGGELCSLRYKHNDKWTELIYRACDYTKREGWRGKAPLLWPATGATDGPYSHNGKQYTMAFHGFAQNMPWQADILKADKREARALLSLSDTGETRKSYPFSWRLTVEYRLREGRLYLVYSVGSSSQNTGSMPFSIGNHMTFRMPFLEGTDPVKMRIESTPSVMFHKDSRNLPTGETKKPPFSGATEAGALPVNLALSLGGYASDPTLVVTDPQGIRLRLKHTAERKPSGAFIQFNLWGDPKAGYFSPEPWVGGQNSFHNKIGLLSLAPGQAWQWTIELYPMTTATI